MAEHCQQQQCSGQLSLNLNTSGGIYSLEGRNADFPLRGGRMSRGLS